MPPVNPGLERNSQRRYHPRPRKQRRDSFGYDINRPADNTKLTGRPQGPHVNIGRLQCPRT